MHDYSKEELSLMNDAQVLLLKRRVIKKVTDDFSKLETSFKQILKVTPDLNLPEGTLKKAGKISKGENYKGLPYLVLDYPRLLNKDQILNIRLLFWWGNYYSMSLHLAGTAWHRYQQKVIQMLQSLQGESLLVQYEGSPWEHDVSLPFFVPVGKMEFNHAEHLYRTPFFRILNLLPLESVEHLEYFAMSTFEKYASFLRT